MYPCPHCGQALVKRQSDYGLFWACEGCNHWLVSLAILRRTIETSFYSKLWQEVRNSGEGQGANCPMCSKPMNQVFMGTPESPLTYLVCKNCVLSWLSPEERAAMPVQAAPVPKEPAPEEPKEKVLPQEAAQLLALHKVELLGERASRERQFDASHLPYWQKFLAIVGMPIEDDPGAMIKFPWLTGLLTLVTIGCSLYFFGDFRAPETIGFVPRDYDQEGGITFLTSFLIHGGWVHLLTNMYFLFVFGRVVEDKIGGFLFLALILFSTIGGNAMTLCFDPQSDIPHVGASGGIAGVLLFYAFTFPRKKLVFFFSTYGGLLMPRLVRIPAWAALVMWVALQLFGASFQKVGMSSVSYSAHLGGFLAGLLFWLAWKALKGKVVLEKLG